MSLDQKVRAAIAKHSTPALRDEIEYHLEIDREEPIDLYTILNDISDREDDNESRTFQRPLRKIFIELGVYIPKTDEQIRNTVTLGGKKYAFQMDGTKYDFNKHPTRR